MPIYEGIGMINEKHSVVLEIGKAYTRAGFAGESSPRCMIPSYTIPKDKEGTVSKPLSDFKDEKDLYQMLVEFLHHIYCRHLLVTPKDRKVVIVESLFATTKWRHVLAKVLYLHYEVLSVLWVPSHLAASSTTGTDTALVIDCGAGDAQVTPVFKGVTILTAVVDHELGSEAFDRNLKSLLLENCQNKSASQLEPLLTPSKIEDIRVRCCVVTSTARAKILKDPNANANTGLFKSFTYSIDGENFLRFDGKVRELGGEIWFQNDDLDGISLPLMVLEALSRCPIDTRKPLAKSILISGGTCMLPGFRGRLLKELNSMQKAEVTERNYVFKLFDPAIKENCVNWLGGALYGATEAMGLRSVSKEFFLKHGLVPDWCNLQFNMVNGLNMNSSGTSAYGSGSSPMGKGL